MIARTATGRIIRSLRLRASAARSARRTPPSPEAPGPPPWVVRARPAPLPEPDAGSRNRLTTPSQRRARPDVRGTFMFGGMQ